MKLLPSRTARLLLFIFFVAAVPRFIGLDWDGGRGFHPDERRIVFALEEISFRPLQLNPHFFAYGSFPLYILRAWTSAAAAIGIAPVSFSGRLMSGRAFSAAVSVAMVGWLAWLAFRLYGRRAGLLAATLLALAVLPIQHAHFITFDLHQAFLVLATLERLVAYTFDRRRRTLFVGAAIAGFALATKVSSAPLLLPVAIAALGVAPGSRGGVGPRLVSVVIAFAASAACFVIGEPYALLDPQFLHDIREQGTMVRNAGNVPYTIQYLGTRPYLDDLTQAFTWGLGPVLGIVAGIASVAAVVRWVRRPSLAEGILLSFFLPYLLVTGWFPVKFMRYLLPLYPLWCLYAARWLAGTDERRPRLPLRAAAAVTVASTAVWAISFAGIYTRPHPWVAASEWFYRSFPAGARVATPHWEEGFPVGVGRETGDRYANLELPLYEGDGPAKIELLAARLAEADAIVFPSKRLYGAISNAPERYPRTNRVLALLFAGDLGFELGATFASRPSILGIEWNDDLSDESFTVYDHPKTLIFRKQEVLDAKELERRMTSAVPSKPIDRAAMLSAGGPTPLEASPVEPRSSSSTFGVATWTIALGAFLFAGHRLLGFWFPHASPLALSGLGPVCAYLLFAWISWLLPSVRLASFSATTTLVAGLVVVGLATRARPTPRDATAAILLFTSFFVFLAIRAMNPEIFWGEKPMDFSFVSSLYRSTELPPPEPWMSGKIINYPYFGHFAVVALGKATGISPGLAFNLGIALVAALATAAAYGAGAAITGTRRGGLVAAFLGIFAGNLAGIPELVSRRAIGFDTFWATSRVIEGTINEFPLWSFLFADLHAHVMAIPIGFALAGLFALWVTAAGSARAVAPLSFALGALAATNTWGFPIYAGAIAGVGLVASMVERRLGRLVAALIAIVVSFGWFAPYWLAFTSPPRNVGFETAHTPLGGFLLIFGLFLVLWLGALAAHLRRVGNALAPWLATLTILAAAAVSVRVLALSLAAWSFRAAFGSREPAIRASWLFAAGAALLGATADTIFLWDRMNTVFKLYIEMWLLLAVASAAWISWIRDRELPAAWRVPATLVLVLAVIGSVATAGIDVVGTIRTHRVPGPRPTLDGTAYLAVHRPHDAAAIQWLNREIRGTPVLLEAQERPYEEYGRISMNTGLPAVLGWEYHLSQRAHRWPELERRKADVRMLYDGIDRATVEAILERYRVSLVYLGALERKTYAARGLAKFAQWKDVFQPVYQNGGAEVYAVVRNFQWGQQPPVLETVTVATEQAEAPEEPRAQMPLGRLREPRGVAIDSHGHVFVADFGNARIQVFDASLRPMFAFGRRGDEAGEFRDPCGVAVGPHGLVYVADTWNHRVQVFEHDGSFVRQWQKDFYGPRGIAVAPDGKVWVADTGNGRVVVFSSDGALVAELGKKGSGVREFNEPIGILVGEDGRVFVADAANRRIVVLSNRGEWLGAWPVDGWKPVVYREPYVGLLADDDVVVSDPTGARLLVFGNDGKVKAEKPLTPGAIPTGVARDARGALIVGDVRREQLVTIE